MPAYASQDIAKRLRAASGWHVPPPERTQRAPYGVEPYDVGFLMRRIMPVVSSLTVRSIPGGIITSERCEVTATTKSPRKGARGSGKTPEDALAALALDLFAKRVLEKST